MSFSKSLTPNQNRKNTTMNNNKNFAEMTKTPARNTQPCYSQTTDDLDHVLGFMGSLVITRPLWTKAVRDGYHRKPLMDVKSTYYSNMTAEDFLGMTVTDWLDVESRMKDDPACDVGTMRENRMEAYIRYGNISLEQAVAAIGTLSVVRILRDYLEDHVNNL